MNFDDKVGLVLSGGGARGAYQIGVWKALKDCGIEI
ncbi:patatin-like phospholipase family protein, partial [Mesotoga sp.]